MGIGTEEDEGPADGSQQDQVPAAAHMEPERSDCKTLNDASFSGGLCCYWVGESPFICFMWRSAEFIQQEKSNKHCEVPNLTGCVPFVLVESGDVFSC